MKKYFTKEYILEHKKQAIRIGTITAIVFAILFVFLFKTGNSAQIPVDETLVTEKAQAEDENAKLIIVDVSGAVNVPQVVELKFGSRVSDAIDAAGGLTEKADIVNINRAAEIQDGEKIYIPTQDEAANTQSTTEENVASSNISSSISSSRLVNINSASNSELQTLNGIGSAIAEKILLYRETNGRFKKLEDLKNVNGIGDKIFEKLKANITI